MILHVALHDTKTNERAIYDLGWDGTGGEEGLEFMFSEGNYACDCNRSLFFQRAIGMKEDDVVRSTPESSQYYSDCNTGPNRFVVTSIVRKSDGKILYREDG